LSVATTFLTALFSFGLAYGWILAATALLMALVVKFFYQPRRAMTVMRETERQRAKEHTRGRLSFLLPQFTFGNVSSQTVLEHSSIIETTRDEFNLEMLSLVRIISLAVIACMGFLFLVDADNLVPALVSLNMLGTAINQLLECMSHLSFAENKFNEFKEMLGKLERERMFGTLELPWSWSLTKAEIPRQSAIVSLDES
jgi:NADH:ubiquinone oxidoreductase subunit 2 (subunit N)